MQFKFFMLTIALLITLSNYGMQEKAILSPFTMLAMGASEEDLLLVRAMFYENEVKAYKIYSKLADRESDEKWHEQALLQKGCSLRYGKGVAQDLKEALKCYQICFKRHKSTKALLYLGELCESAGNYTLAGEYYKKALENQEPMAAFRYARLLYLEKIEFKTENQLDEILHYIRPIIRACAESDSILKASIDTLVLYAMILLDNDCDDEFITIGLPGLHVAAQHGDASAMHQLGILYRHGLYVEKDLATAEKYFQRALNSENTQANLVTKFYMYLRGDGVSEDKNRAVEYLEQAKNGDSNIQDILDDYAKEIEEVESLVVRVEKQSKTTRANVPSDSDDDISEPTKKQLKREKRSLRRERIFRWFAPEISSVQVEQVNEQSKQRAIYSILDTLRVSRNIPKSFPYKTIVQKCNALSVPVDGSSIEIDRNKQVVLIHDPKFKKEFSLPFDEGEFHYDIEPKTFKYDDRIKQQLNISGSNKDPHKFGQAADYAMQLFGVLNPYLGKKKKKEDSLIHPVALLKPSKENGNFEYTFFKSKKTYKLYHRMFKKFPKTLNK